MICQERKNENGYTYIFSFSTSNGMCCMYLQVYYYIVDSPRNEGKEFFEINLQSGEIFTKTVFDREKKGAYALEVEARDGAPSARPNSNGPNSGKSPTPSPQTQKAHFSPSNM